MSNYISDATRANSEDAVLRNSHKRPVMVNDLGKQDPVVIEYRQKPIDQ